MAKDAGRLESGLQSLTTLYEVVSELSWPDDYFDEKSGLLTRISYLAWLHAQTQGSYSELTIWEERTVGHVIQQESVEAFLSLKAEAKSDQLNRRFLSDPAVLLATIAQLKTMLDREPLRCLRELAVIHQWLAEKWEGANSSEEAEYLFAEVVWLLAGANRLCGRYRDSEIWLSRLDHALERTAGAESLKAKASYLKLTVLHHRRLYEDVVNRLPALEGAFRQLDMPVYAGKCILLKAVSLKEVGRESEARPLLEALISDRCLQDKQVRALALICLAELDGRVGRFDLAMASLGEAAIVVKGECFPIAVAHLHGIKAEILRDQGSLVLAADSYRDAAAIYMAAGMKYFAAYVRVILAETLLAAGREDQAAKEILAALPTIAEGRCVEEAMVAMILLRESVRRQRIDGSALRDLREQLDRMRKDGEV